MQNMVMNVSKKGILTVKINLNETIGYSRTGKSILIASTEGNIDVPDTEDEIKIGLNVYKPNPEW